MNDDGEIEYRRKDGTWHTIKRESTGDEELDALWAMTADEVDQIANDDSHPLQDKAKQIQEEVSSGFRRVAKDLAQSWVRPLDVNLRWSLPGTRWDNIWKDFASDFGKTLGQHMVWSVQRPAWGTDMVAREPEGEYEEPESDVVAEDDEVEVVELERSGPPEEASIGDFFSMVQYIAAAQDEGNFERSQMRQENLEAAREASEWAEKSHSKANGAMWWAIVAVLVGVASLAVDIFGWGAG